MRLHKLTFLIRRSTACLLMCACSASTIGAAPGTAAPTVSVIVNPAIKHPISPYIYGINFATQIDGAPSALTLDRWGGNRATAYNWETNASNAGSDYQYENDNAGGNKEAAADVSTW